MGEGGRNKSLSLVSDPGPGLGSPDLQSRVFVPCEGSSCPQLLPIRRLRQEKKERRLTEYRSHSVWRQAGRALAPEAERNTGHKMGEPGAV